MEPLPESPDALGLRHLERKSYAAAEAAFRRALAAEPGRFDLLNNLGSALIGQGRAAEAHAVLVRALSLSPDHPVILRNLGDALAREGRADEAERAFRRAVAVAPERADSHYQLGFFLYQRNRWKEAEAAFRRSLDLAPASADAHNMAGNALLKLGRLDESLAHLREAVRRAPGSALFHSNLGLCHRSRAEYREALAAFDRAIELAPEYAEARFGRAMLRLLLGDFERGWAELDWRLKVPGHPGITELAVPAWDGGELQGKTVFVHAEQGYGDTIQFVRFLPLVKAKGAKEVIFCCDEVLRGLFEGAEGYDRFVTRRSPPPGVDCHVALLSLPGRLGTRADTIPARIPYLRPDPGLVAKWRARLDGLPGRRIGLAWAGRPSYPSDHVRSMPVSFYRPLLAQYPGDCFISLHVGAPAEQARALPASCRLHDFSKEIGDFANTAALIANLDLVITVDTVFAHLAGALGRPVWTLLNFDPEWRWMLGRDSTPWYPTMTLLRQGRPGNWEAVIHEAVGRLALRGDVAGSRLVL